MLQLLDALLWCGQLFRQSRSCADNRITNLFAYLKVSNIRLSFLLDLLPLDLVNG